MSIYDINYNNQVKALLPPDKRKPKILAWLYSLVKPLQWNRDSFFGDYVSGATYLDWSPLTSYNKYDRVRWQDKGIYECLKNGASFLDSPTGSNTSAIFWMKVQDNFIGARERMKYNSQIILLEYELNKWYFVSQADPQIFITQNTNPNAFLMGDTGPYSSPMADDSNFTTTYMGNAPTFTLTDFTVNVPTALFVTLGATTQDRENNIRSFVEKYRIAGISYKVITY